MSEFEMPLKARFDGVCNVCGGPIKQGESNISPFWERGNIYWRHTGCLDLYCIPFKYSSNCNDCKNPIEEGEYGYWSKHNGTWCLPCGDKLRPKVNVSISHELRKVINRS